MSYIEQISMFPELYSTVNGYPFPNKTTNKTLQFQSLSLCSQIRKIYICCKHQD